MKTISLFAALLLTLLFGSCHTSGRVSRTKDGTDPYMHMAFHEKRVESPYAGATGKVTSGAAESNLYFYEMDSVRAYAPLDSSGSALRFDGILGRSVIGQLFEQKLLNASMFFCPVKSEKPCTPHPDSSFTLQDGRIYSQVYGFHGFKGPCVLLLSVRSIDSQLHSPGTLRRMEFRVGYPPQTGVSVFFVEVKNENGQAGDSWKKFLEGATLNYFCPSYSEI